VPTGQTTGPRGVYRPNPVGIARVSELFSLNYFLAVRTAYVPVTIIGRFQVFHWTKPPAVRVGTLDGLGPDRSALPVSVELLPAKASNINDIIFV